MGEWENDNKRTTTRWGRRKMGTTTRTVPELGMSYAKRRVGRVGGKQHL